MALPIGSAFLETMIDGIEDSSLSHSNRVLVYEVLIECFENYECDTINECLGADPAFDEAWKNTGHILDDTEAEDDYFDDED